MLGARKLSVNQAIFLPIELELKLGRYPKTELGDSVTFYAHHCLILSHLHRIYRESTVYIIIFREP